MKKLTDLLIVLSLLLFVCICIPQFSDAQKLKPGVKDIKKPGISKSTVKRPGLSNSIKSNLPALELSRLALDSGCNITGYIQNKGQSISATHSDFLKIEVKVGYTLDGKTKEVLLKTRQASNKNQPLLLVGAATLRNFVQGRPAKFTSKLQVPPTGKGFAIVFAEVDPSNKIRETSKGEQKKRIQARLRSRCAPRVPGSIKVNPPKRVGEAVSSATSRTVKPPSAVSSPQTTGRVYQDFGIKVTHPNTARVGDNVTVKYQFPRSSSPPDRIMIYLYQFCKNLFPRDLPIDRIYDGPPLASHRINLSTIDFSSVRCPGKAKFFFAVFEVGEAGETVTDRREGHSRHFTYLSNTFDKPGSKSVKASKIEIDPDTKMKVNIPVPTSFNTSNMLTKEGGRVGLRFISPVRNQKIPKGGNIALEYEFLRPQDSISEVKYFLVMLGPDDNFIKAVLFDSRTTTSGYDYPSNITEDGGYMLWSYSMVNPDDRYFSSYQIGVQCFNSDGTVVVAQGMSERFTMGGVPASEGGGEAYFDPAPISNGLQITSPAEGDVGFLNSRIDIRYTIDLPDIPDNSPLKFSLVRVEDINTTLTHTLALMNADIPVFIIARAGNIGRYRIKGEIFNGSIVIASGYSGAFQLGAPSYSPGDNGIEVTSPTSTDWIKVTEGTMINVNYTINNCTEALSNATIVLTRYSGTETQFELHRGPLNASGSMSFPVPSGWLGDDAREAIFSITIAAGRFGSSGEFELEGGPECMARSETFKMSF